MHLAMMNPTQAFDVCKEKHILLLQKGISLNNYKLNALFGGTINESHEHTIKTSAMLLRQVKRKDIRMCKRVYSVGMSG